MINFDAVDFSEWRSKEVLGFFWRSMYVSVINSDAAWLNYYSIFIQYPFIFTIFTVSPHSRVYESNTLGTLKNPLITSVILLQRKGKY